LFQPPILDGKQLRIFFHSNTLARIVLAYIQDRNGSYGTPLPEIVAHKPKVLLEFSSPNIVTELNGKHFRSTLLGAQLAISYQAQGWEVVKLNYLGDWGKPIGLLGAGFERFGSEEQLTADPINHLRDVYKRISELFAPELAASKKARDDQKARDKTGDSAEIESKGIFAERNAFFSRLENGDEKATEFWRKFRDASIENYMKIYARMNVEFDEYCGESQVRPETMHDVENALKAKGICEESEGSLVIQLQNHGSKHGTAIIRDRTGSSTYLLRELAAAVERSKKYAFDKMVYVVANDQHATHFHRLTKILELLEMGDLASKLHHVSFNEASHMPEPSDPNQPLHEILDKCEESIQRSLTSNSKQATLLVTNVNATNNLTASACFAQASSVKRTSELKFDIEKMASFEPGTALYLLAWLGRLSAVTAKPIMPVDSDDGHGHYLDDFDHANLLRLLAHFPDVVNASFRALEPATIMTYLGNVTAQLVECFEDEEMISAKDEGHLQFLKSTSAVLSNGLRLLGITR
jgi:arginyl-tRNA synthetase